MSEVDTSEADEIEHSDGAEFCHVSFGLQRGVLNL